MSNVIGLRGAVAPISEPSPDVVEIAQRLLDLAASGEIMGIQAVVLHRDSTAVSQFRRGGINYAMVGMLMSAAQASIADLEKQDLT